MKPQFEPCFARRLTQPAAPFHQPLESPLASAAHVFPTAASGSSKTRIAQASLLTALLLLCGAQVSLHAQQDPGYQQYPQQSQQAPDPQGYPQYSGSQQQSYAQPQQGYPQAYQDQSPQPPMQQQAQPLDVRQLEQLVAPIALYPDSLVAQVLAGATYPAQIVDADHWRRIEAYAPPEQIVAGADAQPWDPSVKSLTAFPDVLALMDQNLRWTIALGNAYFNQPQDVLDVVQVMRQRAQDAGTLQNTPQQAVTYNQGYVQIAPSDPQQVAAPSYDPWSSYGQQVEPYHGFSLLSSLGSLLGGSSQGQGGMLGSALSAFTGAKWGFLQWGLNWLTQSVLFQQSPFSTQSTSVADWGLPNGGPRAPYRGRPVLGYSNPSRPFQSQPVAHPVAGMPRQAFPPSNGFQRPTGPSHNPMPESARQPERNSAPQPFRGPERSPSPYQPGRPTPGSFRPNPEPAYNRAPLEASNRFQSPENRPPYFNRPSPGYGSSFNSGSTYGQGYGYSSPSRPAPVFNDRQAPRPGRGSDADWRAPNQGYSRSTQQNDYRAYNGTQAPRGYQPENNFRNEQRFKPEKNYKPEKAFKQPKAPKMPKGYGGGHSGFGGGHSGFGGGGHSSGLGSLFGHGLHR